MPCQEAGTHEGIQRNLIHGFSVPQEMEGGIDVGAVMGAQRKSGQIADISGGGGQQGFLLRLRITGVNCTGKDLLGNIIDFHRRSDLHNGLDEGKDIPVDFFLVGFVQKLMPGTGVHL